MPEKIFLWPLFIMRKFAFIYTVMLGIIWEITYALIIIGGGFLISLVTEYLR
jgi:hypothetical protein